jgi:hypothetical protein
MSYEFVPIKTDGKTLQEITSLLKIVFPKSKKFNSEFIEWQYKNNPDGEVIGYNAYKSGKLVAHYALMPIRATVYDKKEKGLLSLNTATHPEHQGNGLFIKLAKLSYELAKNNDYSFVLGVANAKSSYGFIYKLNFQKVGELVTKIGYGSLKNIEKFNNKNIYFTRDWSAKSISWRLMNPLMNYKIDNKIIFSKTSNFFVKAILFKTDNNFLLIKNELELGLKPFNLWIGIDNSIDWKGSFYFNIPKIFKPSPLNLIFKDLTEQNRKLEMNNVLFNALDFDAY